MKRAGVILLLTFVAMVLGFQNCANPDVEFKAVKKNSLDGNSVAGAIQNTDEKSEVVDPVDPITPQDPVAVSPTDPGPSEPEPTDPVMPPKEEEVVKFDGCKSFVEIEDVDIVEVPARTSDGVCYYIRLMSEVAAHKSGTMYASLAKDVFARDHGKGSNSPFVIADVEIMSLRLLGERKVALSSKFNDPEATMKIDNFFLLELLVGGQEKKWAYGTKDSIPKDGPILVEDFEVKNFRDYIEGGTATVTAINMTPEIPTSSMMSLRFRGLDCGGAAAASDVFLVFH